MKTSSRWILYSLLRVGLFVAALFILMLLGIEVIPAAIVATIIAFAISYIFFRDHRDALAQQLQQRRENPVEDPDAAEHASLDDPANPTDR
jgi:MFS superfamily sulfate permease-like transporter